MDRLQREIQQALDLSPNIRGFGRGGFPALNVGGTPQTVEVYAFAPGVDPQSLQIDLERGMLTIAGERKSQLPEAGKQSTLHINERFAGSFRRVISLPEDADPDAVDASFKWLPGFRGGQTLPDELSRAAKVHTPAIHEWLELWNTVALANPGLFATVMAVLESLAALALIFGVLSNVAFIGTAVLSFGIWSGAEGFHLPFHAGMTDLGPSAGYVFASLALFFAAAGSTWSVDTWLRPRLGRFALLAAPATN
jgi:HSP20 family protein